MKKGKVLASFVLALLMTFSLVFARFDLYADVEEKEGITLSSIELEFFSKMADKKLYKTNGGIVVDTVNGIYNETIFVDGIYYEKNALSYLFYKSIVEDNIIGMLGVKSLKMTSNNNKKIQHLYSLSKTKNLTKRDIENFLYEDNFAQNNIELFENLLLNKVEIYDPNVSISLNTTYYYETIYVGNYQTYNLLCTDIGVYSIKAQYYMKDDQKIYTGETSYVINVRFDSYDHLDRYTFDYNSFDILNWSSPLTKITVLLDFWGEEKMILSAKEFVLDYKLSREEHYNRNQYNKINGVPADELYPNKEALGNAFGDKEIGAYFHQLMPHNNANEKYTKEIKYYDVNLGVELHGSVELVYDSKGNVVYDSLVTFSFNFGVSTTYSENEISKAHYFRDVYPYLVWGNDYEDYMYYTAFERFVWDKASIPATIGKFLGLSDPNKYNNKSGEELISLYINGKIGNYFGTSIPDVIQNNQVRWDLRFDKIQTQNIKVFEYTDKDWTTLIKGVYSNIGGYIQKIEIFDEVNYQKEGTYKVKVGIKDRFNRLRTQEFKVVVSTC